LELGRDYSLFVRVEESEYSDSTSLNPVPGCLPKMGDSELQMGIYDLILRLLLNRKAFLCKSPCMNHNTYKRGSSGLLFSK
jgi:hypothetical protein